MQSCYHIWKCVTLKFRRNCFACVSKTVTSQLSLKRQTQSGYHLPAKRRSQQHWHLSDMVISLQIFQATDPSTISQDRNVRTPEVCLTPAQWVLGRDCTGAQPGPRAVSDIHFLWWLVSSACAHLGHMKLKPPISRIL